MAENKLSQKQVLLMAIAGGVAVANIYYNQPILKDIQESAHVTESQSGAVSFLSQAGYGLGLFFLTPLGDKINRKKLTLILLLLLCIPLLVMCFSENIYVLWIASFCIGLFSVAAQVILPLAASLDRVSTGNTVGKIFSGILIGILAARVLSGFVASSFGWHAVYMIACGLVLIILLLLYKYLPDVESNFSSNYLQLLKSTLLQVKRFSVLRISSAIGALMFGVFCSFWTNLTFHLSGKPFDYSPDQIVINSGIEGSIVVQKIKEGKGDFGFNARTEVYENLLAAGVIDPTKVTRIALENAASIAGMLLTTECVISDRPEKDKPSMPAMGGGGMGDMGY